MPPLEPARPTGSAEAAQSSDAASREWESIEARYVIGQAAHAAAQAAAMHERANDEPTRREDRHDATRPSAHRAPPSIRQSRAEEPTGAETALSLAPASLQPTNLPEMRVTLAATARPPVDTTGARGPHERLGAAPETPCVSVSIGRIEVEIAPPPAPIAAPSRPQPMRTRGFEAYARARRGKPR